jgi:hypothetical protein
MTLYDIDQAIMDCVDPDTGEVDVERMESLMLERDTKVEGIALWIIDLKADAESMRREIDRLTTKKRVTENKIESLKAFLANALDGEKFKSAKCAVSYRKSAGVVVDNEEAIPLDYWKVHYTVNKTAIKDAIAKGEYVPGAHIQENNSVIIK